MVENALETNRDKFYAAWAQLDQEIGHDPIYGPLLNDLYDSYKELCLEAHSYLSQLLQPEGYGHVEGQEK